ncbi:MAG: hypothetical protein LBU79_09220 [Planctomycetota bacterium]|nr:hypothetical protein [Planctomycetota bacterium]
MDIKVITKTGQGLASERQGEEQAFTRQRLPYYCAQLFAEPGKRGDI